MCVVPAASMGWRFFRSFGSWCFPLSCPPLAPWAAFFRRSRLGSRNCHPLFAAPYSYATDSSRTHANSSTLPRAYALGLRPSVALRLLVELRPHCPFWSRLLLLPPRKAATQKVSHPECLHAAEKFFSPRQANQPILIVWQPSQSRESHSRGLTGMSSPPQFRHIPQATGNQPIFGEKFTAVHL